MVTRNGTSSGELLIGTSESDILNGLGGSDTLIGGSGNDTFNGGDGSFDVDTVREIADVNFTVTDSNLFGLGIDSLFGIERFELFGGSGNNILNAAATTKRVTYSAGEGGDRAFGGSNNDLLIMGRGDDVAEGGAGSDVVNGGAGSDILSGVQPANVNPGRGEIDQLTGDDIGSTITGRDSFILGDANKIYYNDGLSNGSSSFGITGRSDYALIGDFRDGEDVIVLKGGVQYNLVSVTENGIAGIGITTQLNGSHELLGLIRNGNLSQLQINNSSAGGTTTIT